MNRINNQINNLYNFINDEEIMISVKKNFKQCGVNKNAKHTVWCVSSPITMFSKETATAAETWHHHYDNNYYYGCHQYTNNDSNCIARNQNKLNTYMQYKIKHQMVVPYYNSNTINFNKYHTEYY